MVLVLLERRHLSWQRGQLGLMQQPPLTGLMPLLVFLLRQHIEVTGWTPAIGCGLLLGRYWIDLTLRAR